MWPIAVITQLICSTSKRMSNRNANAWGKPLNGSSTLSPSPPRVVQEDLGSISECESAEYTNEASGMSEMPKNAIKLQKEQDARVAKEKVNAIALAINESISTLNDDDAATLLPKRRSPTREWGTVATKQSTPAAPARGKG